MKRAQEKAAVKSLTMLMIEVEQPEGISARKLVVEVAKHNVLTAYTREDGLGLFNRFPNVDAVLIHADVPECASAIRELRRVRPEVPVIVATPVEGERLEGADYTVSSHAPESLLQLLADEFGASKTNNSNT